MKLLVVEDDSKIRSFLRKGLQAEGHSVECLSDGDEALYRASGTEYDAIVLDIMIPGRDGLSVLKELRNRKVLTPVLVLTARSMLNERIEGLNAGADDYLTKPFYIEELCARLNAIVRRATGESQNVLSVAGVVLNLLTRAVTVDDEEVELTARECNLLELFMRSPDRIFSRAQILEHVWGFDFDPQTNVVDVLVRRLRQKLDQDTGNSRIDTVRGVGYRFRRNRA